MVTIRRNQLMPNAIEFLTVATDVDRILLN